MKYVLLVADSVTAEYCSNRMTCENIGAELLMLMLAAAVGLITLLQGVGTNQAKATSLAPVNWNSTNPIFKSSMKDHVIEVKLFDDIDFVCPYLELSEDSSEWREYFTIYMVSRREYEDCSIDPRGAATPVLNCTSPHLRKRFTILFEPFQSIPNAHEYQAGASYYYITTSTGFSDEMDNLHHGACLHHNMKLTIRVCCRISGPPESSSFIRSNSVSSRLPIGDNIRVTNQTTNRFPLWKDDRSLSSTPRSMVERRPRTTFPHKFRQRLTTSSVDDERQSVGAKREHPNAVIHGTYEKGSQTPENFNKIQPKSESAKHDRLFSASGNCGRTADYLSTTSTIIFLVSSMMSIPLSLIS